MTREELNARRDDLFCTFCGKQCKSLNSLNQHSTRCNCNPSRKDHRKLGEYSHLNFKGQSKFTNEVIARSAASLQEAYDSGRFVCAAKGKPGSFRGKHHTEATKKLLSEIGKYNAKNHLNGWKAGSSKKQNRYEEHTAKLLTKCGVPFKAEYCVSTHSKGSKDTPSYYQLDFLVCDKIDLELDGSGHNFLADNKRDKFISNIYDVYRIKHNDSIDQLELALLEFITYLQDKKYL